ncbi:ATP synthase F1 subunit delta [Deltaproteobacteria bacterium TL4]
MVIAKRYAKALLGLVKDAQDLETVGRNLEELAETFEGSPLLQSTLAGAKISMSDKQAIVSKILETLQVQPVVQTFTKYLLNKRRIVLLLDIERVFSVLLREKLGRLDAKVTVASELAQDAVKGLEKQLSLITGKTVNVTQTIDPLIIGGVITRIGSVVIDGSLRNQLTRVRQSIIRG